MSIAVLSSRSPTSLRIVALRGQHAPAGDRSSRSVSEWLPELVLVGRFTTAAMGTSPPMLVVILLIVVIVLLLGGGGYYGRRRRL
jgi:LPXTG-motif cell wall-anchored protein